MMVALSRYPNARLDPTTYWPQALIVDTASTPNIDAMNSVMNVFSTIGSCPGLPTAQFLVEQLFLFRTPTTLDRCNKKRP